MWTQQKVAVAALPGDTAAWAECSQAPDTEDPHRVKGPSAFRTAAHYCGQQTMYDEDEEEG
jgi:hypothetical protein